MAKITITIEDDLIAGKVKVVSDPTFGQLVQRELSGNAQDLTPAHSYAALILAEVANISKRAGQHALSKRGLT